MNGVNRRTFLQTSAISAAATIVGNVMSGRNASVSAQESIDISQRIRGPFPILSTPYTESGDVDYDVLAKSARFVDACGSSGMIWPQAADSEDLLTLDEKLRGMEVLTAEMKGKSTALCLGVQGKNTEQMLVVAQKAAEWGPTAVISRPPDDGTSEEDLRDYWHALAEVVSCPIIIQTFGGTQYKGPGASVALMLELARDFPQFGYVKEETQPIFPRMREMIAAKPTIKTVFSAMGGFAWLGQLRAGTEGLITERAVYADLLMKIWNAAEAKDWVTAADAQGKLLLMLNMRETISGSDLRGPHLYVWQKRGVFKNRLSRQFGPKNTIPEKPILSEQKLSNEEIDDIDARFEAIRPALKEISI